MIPASDSYEGRAIKGKIQFGETEAGTLQIAIDMELRDQQKTAIGVMTTILYFTDKSSVFAFERLHLLGWKGKTSEEIESVLTDDLYSNWVPCRVTQPEQYKDPKDGAIKMGNSKLEIIAGQGTIQLSKPLDPASFKARLKAVEGGSGGSSGGGQPPPF